MAAKYKFDGVNLKGGSKTISNIKGNDIREGSGIKFIANMKGDDIRQGSRLTKIATMKDVEKVIDGQGRIVKAARWFYFCR